MPFKQRYEIDCQLIHFILKEEFEDTKGEIRIRRKDNTMAKEKGQTQIYKTYT